MKTFSNFTEKQIARNEAEARIEAATAALGVEGKANGTKTAKYAQLWKEQGDAIEAQNLIDAAPITCPVTGFDLTNEARTNVLKNATQAITPDVLEANQLYVNHYGYSDTTPYEVVKASASGKTLTIRRMDAKLKEGSQPNIVPGGFSGHCTNNHALEYDITSNENNPTYQVRITKKGAVCGKLGRVKLALKPSYHYDYNF